jgi:copper(I)-binding protein
MQPTPRSAAPILLSALLAIMTLGGCDRPGSPTLTVTDAWVRLPAVSGRPGAGYFTLKGGTSDDRLTTVASAVVERIELHESGMDKGMMTMRPLSAGAKVAAGKAVTFAPGGNHAMLFGINPAITPGTAIPLQFRFESGAIVAVEAKTVSAGQDGPPGHEQH